MKLKLFISYSRSVKTQLRPIIEMLRYDDYEVWWDADIPAMADWWASILENIGTAELCVFVVSEKSVQSPYCLKELEYATKRNRPILPFVIDDHTKYVIPSEVTLMRNQWFVYDGEPAHMLTQLNGAISKLNWNLYNDRYSPRPSEPGKGLGTNIKEFQQAVSLAENGFFDEAGKCFRALVTGDPEEWGTESDSWITRLQLYAEISELADHHSTFAKASRKWSAFMQRADYDAGFDPLKVREKLSGAPPISQPIKSIPTPPAAAPKPKQSPAETKAYPAALSQDIGSARRMPMQDISSARRMPIVEVAKPAPAILRITPEQNRLLKIMLDPNRPPEERAEAGREINKVGDPREGVGLRADGLPDIAWCEVPAGVFTYQQNTKLTLPTFNTAKYPITYKQFGAFLSAPDGFKNTGWWNGLHADGLAQQKEGPGDQAWKLNNHPRENVSWYDAMAFCRWLSAKLAFEVRLPLETGWEKAARGVDGREYTWGDGYRIGYANVDETQNQLGPHYLKQTAAVGIYAHGDSPNRAADLSGNVWEWTLNEYDKPEQQNWSNKASRSRRGGSWRYFPDFGRATFRGDCDPHVRDSEIGFRVVCSVPSL